MANEIARGLQALGVAGELAVEIQKQIASGTGSYKRMQELGLPPLLAKSLADMIDAESVDADLLARHGMVPNVAAFIAKRINGSPKNTVAPSISGTPVEGGTLTLDNGTWTGDTPRTFSRVWKRDGVEISGATATTYELVADDVDAMISATVTLTNAYGSASADADAVGPVEAA